jgi:hypothetical protein
MHFVPVWVIAHHCMLFDADAMSIMGIMFHDGCM